MPPKKKTRKERLEAGRELMLEALKDLELGERLHDQHGLQFDDEEKKWLAEIRQLLPRVDRALSEMETMAQPVQRPARTPAAVPSKGPKPPKSNR